MTEQEQRYAYEQGYDRGYSNRPIHGAWWPSECPRRGIRATQIKAGWVDGQHDHINGNPKGTSLEFEVLTSDP